MDIQLHHLNLYQDIQKLVSENNNVDYVNFKLCNQNRLDIGLVDITLINFSKIDRILINKKISPCSIISPSHFILDKSKRNITDILYVVSCMLTRTYVVTRQSFLFDA